MLPGTRTQRPRGERFWTVKTTRPARLRRKWIVWPRRNVADDSRRLRKASGARVIVTVVVGCLGTVGGVAGVVEGVVVPLGSEGAVGVGVVVGAGVRGLGCGSGSGGAPGPPPGRSIVFCQRRCVPSSAASTGRNGIAGSIACLVVVGLLMCVSASLCSSTSPGPPAKAMSSRLVDFTL